MASSHVLHTSASAQLRPNQVYAALLVGEHGRVETEQER